MQVAIKKYTVIENNEINHRERKGLKMKKKIIYSIMVAIIIIGCIIIGTMGLKADLTYSKSVKIDVYLGKTFENNDIKQIAQEVFGKDKTIVQKIEYYEDMASITIKEENAENIDEKLEQLNNKINEKYELENKKDDMQVTHQPKIKLSSILQPYILPLIISSLVILAYVIIRFRKIGIIKTVILYALSILTAEALFLSILAITRMPINRLVMPIALLIYVIVITIVTTVKEKQYNTYQEEEKKKAKK